MTRKSVSQNQGGLVSLQPDANMCVRVREHVSVCTRVFVYMCVCCLICVLRAEALWKQRISHLPQRKDHGTPCP